MDEDTNKVIEEDTRYFKDLEFLVDYKVYPYRIEFFVYQTCPTRAADSDVWEVWYLGEMGPVKDKKDAEVFAEGALKCDGCSDWDFHPGDKGLFGDTQEQLRSCKHFCGRNGLQNLGVLLFQLWDMGQKIPNWRF